MTIQRTDMQQPSAPTTFTVIKQIDAPHVRAMVTRMYVGTYTITVKGFSASVEDHIYFGEVKGVRTTSNAITTVRIDLVQLSTPVNASNALVVVTEWDFDLGATSAGAAGHQGFRQSGDLTLTLEQRGKLNLEDVVDGQGLSIPLLLNATDELSFLVDGVGQQSVSLSVSLALVQGQDGAATATVTVPVYKRPERCELDVCFGYIWAWVEGELLFRDSFWVAALSSDLILTVEAHETPHVRALLWHVHHAPMPARAQVTFSVDAVHVSEEGSTGDSNGGKRVAA